MKNIMRRTVAFMLMACLLLSVMAPITFAESAERTINFGYGDAADATANPSMETSYRDGEWSFVARATDRTITVTSTYVQCNGFNKNATVWFAIRINNIEMGTYDLTFATASGQKGIADVYVVPYTEDADWDAKVAALTNDDCIGVLKGADGTTSFTNVTFEATGDYVFIFKRNTDSTGANLRMNKLTLTPVPVATVETKYDYDFTTLGALLGAAEGNHAGFGYSEEAQALFDDGKINYLPYAKSGSFYSENGKYSYGIFGQNTAADTFFAVKISAAVGTYDFNAAMTSYANAAGTGHIYAIPVSAVEAALATAQETDAEATAGDAIYNLIQDDYAGKQSVEGSFYGTSLSGTVEITSDEDYVIVFYAVAPRSTKTTCWMHFKNFSLTKTASYNSLEAALAATNSKFDTVTLLDDVSVASTLTIGTGATLDLNGNTITGNVVLSNGQIVDNGATKGSVVGTLDATGNKWLPLYNGTGYEFFSYTTESSVLSETESKSGNVEHWFDVELSDEAYELIAAGNSGMTVNVDITWSQGDDSGKLPLTLASDKIAEWATNEKAEEGNQYGLCVQFTNIPEGVTDLTVKITYAANGATVDYESTVAANG